MVLSLTVTVAPAAMVAVSAVRLVATSLESWATLNTLWVRANTVPFAGCTPGKVGPPAVACSKPPAGVAGGVEPTVARAKGPMVAGVTVPIDPPPPPPPEAQAASRSGANMAEASRDLFTANPQHC